MFSRSSLACALLLAPLATITLAGCSSGSISGSQTTTTTGTGSTASGPVASLGSIASFPATAAGTTSAALMVTLSNTGTTALTVSAVALGGTNPSAFAQTNNCASVAAGGSCTVSVTFTPLAAATTYNATLTVTDNTNGVAGSSQSVALTGTGSAATGVSHQLYAFPETDLSVTPLYNFVNAATRSVDMTMYALEDTTFTADLVADCKRGVVVRVILDQNNEKSGNTTAYNALNAQANCSAVWANKAFQVTHQKSIVVDQTQVAILSLNLQSQYYSTTRDFGLIENDSADIAAIEATFNTDYAAGTNSAGTVGASDYTYAPGSGDNNDLIWSPTTAQAAMLGIINNAKTSLLVENEEMSAANIVTALENACTRGVTVHIAMVNDSTGAPYSSYAMNFKALEAAGCGVKTYPDTTTGLYIHAKAVIADYGLATQSVYMGSINYSIASMTENRELGIYISDSASILILYNTMTADYAGATAF